MNATHDKIADIFEKEFRGLSTADLCFAIGYLEAMKLSNLLEEGRITEDEYMAAICS